MEMIRTVINTDLKDIKKFRDNFIALLEDKNYKDETIFKLRLILDELMANSYKHGNLRDFSKLIDISVMLTDTMSLIKVKDEGCGIVSPKTCDLYAESGRGIMLVKSLSDKIIIEENTIACLIKIEN